MVRVLALLVFAVVAAAPATGAPVRTVKLVAHERAPHATAGRFELRIGSDRYTGRYVTEGWGYQTTNGRTIGYGTDRLRTRVGTIWLRYHTRITRTAEGAAHRGTWWVTDGTGAFTNAVGRGTYTARWNEVKGRYTANLVGTVSGI